MDQPDPASDLENPALTPLLSVVKRMCCAASAGTFVGSDLFGNVRLAAGRNLFNHKPLRGAPWVAGASGRSR